MSTLDTTANALRRLDIENALRRLPRDQAQTLFLFYFGAISIMEIARRVHRPEGTIKYWLHQGRQYLARRGYAVVEAVSNRGVREFLSAHSHHAGRKPLAADGTQTSRARRVRKGYSR